MPEYYEKDALTDNAEDNYPCTHCPSADHCDAQYCCTLCHYHNDEPDCENCNPMDI